MRFTRAEFWYGALAAWITFLVLLVLAEVVVAVISDLWYWQTYGTLSSSITLLAVAIPMSLLIGVPVSAAAMLLWAPVVRGIAWRLRGIRSPVPHVAVLLLVGAAVGVSTVGILYLVLDLRTDPTDPHVVIMPAAIAVVLSGVSLPLGWALAVRRAVRDDRGLPRRRRPPTADLDAAAEDGLGS